MLLCNQAESSEETIREKSLIKGQGVTINVSKVRTFWETPKIWKNLPHGFDKSMAKTMRKIFSNYVPFSKSRNFKWKETYYDDQYSWPFLSSPN